MSRFGWRIALAVACAVGILATPIVASADAIPPGEHPVAYCFTIRNMADFPDYAIFAQYEVDDPGPRTVVTQLMADDCTDVYRYYFLGHKTSEPTIFAIRTARLGTPAATDLSSDSPNAIVSSGWSLNPVSTLKNSDKRGSVTDTLTITQLDDSTYTMSYLGRSPTSTGTTLQNVLSRYDWLWYALISIAAAAGIATILLLRRRRA